MMKLRPAVVALSAVALLEGCVTPPLGPTVAVYPPAGKPPATYQEDVAVCEQLANQQTAGGAQQANNQAVGSALLGAALGAGLGAAVGGGRGAGIGAASGAVVGTGVGANSSAYAQYSLQQRYDIIYSQCMVSRGNQLPAPPPGYYPPPPQ